MRTFIALLAALLFSVPAFGRSPQRLAGLLSEMDKLGSTLQRQAAVDQEAGQKEAWRSRLFWYTDMSEAVAAATSQGKPILSLRLLGRLDDELSCANSRFFRKTLYVDPQIASLLRSRYILHWESVRPVPIVTVDYGDGTVVKRTLTGNSIHYLLAPDGRVIDALPGLLDASTFERETLAFADLIRRNPAFDPVSLARYYDATNARIERAPVAPAPARSADLAMAATRSKAIVERPMLVGVRNPSDYVLADSRHNQSVLRPRLIAWLRAQPNPNLKSLNERVYAELFITPLNDPLMGLALPDEAAIVPGFRPSPVAVGNVASK